MRYSGVQYRKFDSRRKFGVELEMGITITKNKVAAIVKSLSPWKVNSTKYQPTTTTDCWHVKTDSTCGPQGRMGPKGIEVASFVGSGIGDLQHIAEVADQLYQHGCEVNNNCGLHIHADATDLSETQVGRLLAYWIKMEEVIASALPRRRLFNEHCRFLPDRVRINRSRKWKAIELYDKLCPVDLGYYENEDRRVNFNLVNFTRAVYYQTNFRKTLELRWPEGTLSAKDIKCWVRLYLGFIESCKNRVMPNNLLTCSVEETLTYLGLGHDRSFTIFSEGLHETRVWFLERILKHYLTNAWSRSQHVEEARNILNKICSPIKNYA